MSRSCVQQARFALTQRLMDLIVLPVFKTLSQGNARLNAASTAC